MRLSIALNTDREVVWGVGGFILTEESPNIVLDTDNLSEQERKTIFLGLRAKKILSTTPPEQIFKPAVKSTNHVVAKLTAPPSPIPAVEKPLDLAVRAREILASNVADVKKSVLGTKDVRLIRMMLVVEEAEKKRSTITKLLQSQIAQFEAAVIQNLDRDDGVKISLRDPAVMGIAGLQVDYTNDVVESEEEEITLDTRVFTEEE